MRKTPGIVESASRGRPVKFDHISIKIPHAQADVVDPSDLFHANSFNPDLTLILTFAQRNTNFRCGLRIQPFASFVPNVRLRR
jgi:hypothetical protein